MTNVFLNSLQLNDTSIKCNITATKVEKNYINQEKPIYSSVSPVTFNTAGDVEKYTFEFTLWGRGDVYLTLLDKQAAIYNEVNNQVVNRQNLRIITDDTYICVDALAVEVIVDEADYDIIATDGPNQLKFKLNCILVRPLYANDLVPNGYEFSNVDGAQVGDK